MTTKFVKPFILFKEVEYDIMDGSLSGYAVEMVGQYGTMLEINCILEKDKDPSTVYSIYDVIDEKTTMTREFNKEKEKFEWVVE